MMMGVDQQLQSVVKIQIMIKEQNYTKVAEYTKKAFQVFCKRVLAAQLIEVLARPKLKEVPQAESQNYFDIDELSNQTPIERKNLDEIDSKTFNNRFTKQMMNQLKEINVCTKIDSICYGDSVCFDWREERELCRMTVMLDSVKLYRPREIQNNSVNARKGCFQICSPSAKFGEERQPIDSQSMVCLRSVSTGCYLQLTTNVLPAFQFGYQLTLSEQIDKNCIFRLVTTNPSSKELHTDFEMNIVSYYSPKIYLNVQKSAIEGVIDREVIGSYSIGTFRVSRSEFDNLKESPYFYIQCVGIGKRVRAEYASFSRQLIRKEYSRLQLDCGGEGEKYVINFQDASSFYTLSDCKQIKEVQIADSQPCSLYQVWEIERIKAKDEHIQCRITNLITSQTLSPNGKASDDLPAYDQRASMLRLRREKVNRNQYMIQNDENISLIGTYNSDRDRYSLKYQQSESKSVGVGKGSIFKFQLVELPPSVCECLVELVECQELLRSNYPFLQKWGFKYEEHQFKLKYSLTDLKMKLVFMRRKIRQICVVVDKLQQLLVKEENQMLGVGAMARETKILELLILYCKMINAKIDNKKYQSKQIFQLATNQLKFLQDKIFNTLYLLIYNDKGNSQIIIQHSIFFNHLLSLYPQIIGQLLQESIKNLCLITAKISKEELVLFEWTRLVDYLTAADRIDVQRKYIDIISEVAIDPNDIGITPYQNKIKEQLFNRTKKKIFPRYINDSAGNYGPLICFQYPEFPIEIQKIFTGSGKSFELGSLFSDCESIEEYRSHIEYINSLLKLMRNLCKDRNRKMPKVVEDYGLTQQYMHEVFRCGQIGWEMVARFLDLYVAMYVVQDPFLSFQKREIKCFAWQKIQSINFQKKTAILFRQFTEQNIALDKLKQFDQFILPLLSKYFNQLQRNHMNSIHKKEFIRSTVEVQIEGSSSFMVFVSVVLEIVNYGFLSYRLIRRYLRIIMMYTEKWIVRQENEEIKRKILTKVVELCKMTEQISTILHGMNILKKIYQGFEPTTTQSSRQEIVDIFKIALEDDVKTLNEDPYMRKRKGSTMVRSGSRGIQTKYTTDHFSEGREIQSVDILKFTLIRIYNQSQTVKSTSMKQLLSLLQLISERGERICSFLVNVFILKSVQEQTLYLQYSGITPLGCCVQSHSSSRRLLNVMKVKELVDKITEESIELGYEDRKKEKIYELNNLLSKILTNMQKLRKSNYQLFGVCQILLQKLNIHKILMMILIFEQHDNYQELIGQIVEFLCLFVEDNSQNLKVMAQIFPELTKRYAYTSLPKLLSMLFGSVKNPEEAFEMIFSHIGKKMKQANKQILFESIYKIVKISPQWLLDRIRGKIIYTLTSLEQFRSYVRGEKISFNFINLLCFVGKDMSGVHQRVKEIIRKSQLLRGLQSSQSNYQTKWLYLRIYHFLYVESQTRFDEIQVDLIIENIFLNELRFLPALCRITAQETIKEVVNDSNSEEDKKNRRKRTEMIKSYFGNLMMEGKQTLSASQQEGYLNFMLNIDEEKQFSMLVCLNVFISRFKVSSIDVLSGYVFKLINFMDQIKIKENTYQSRILNKMYETCQILSQKYNRNGCYYQKLPFDRAKILVQKFYIKVATVVQKQQLSYLQILKCANIQSLELESARSQPGRQKLITQSTFTQFIGKLAGMVNDKEQNGSFPTSQIKQFFNQVREKDTNQMNLLNFLDKLIDVLEVEKEQLLIKHIKQCKSNSDDLQKQSQSTSSNYINCQLISHQIQHYQQTYQMLLKYSMQNKISKTLCELIDEGRNRSKKRSLWEKVTRLHMIGGDFNIVHLLVNVLIEQVEDIEQIEVKEFSRKIDVMKTYIRDNIDQNFVISLGTIYEKIKGRKELAILFGQLYFGLNPYIETAMKANCKYKLSTLQKYFTILGNMNQNTIFQPQTQQKMSIFISQLLISIFNKICTDNTHCEYNYCELLLNYIMSINYNYDRIISILSKNQKFRDNLTLFISNIFKRGVMNTNMLFCKKLSIVNKMCQFVIKVRHHGFSQQIAALLSQWNFDQLFVIIRKNYSHIIKTKNDSQEMCDHKEGCTHQFCNQAKLTLQDSEKVDTLINLLTVIFIASDLKESGYMVKAKSDILEEYLVWRKGQPSKAAEQTIQMFKIVHSIQLHLDGNKEVVYFSLPLINRFSRPSLQRQLSSQINLLNKERYFNNLYKLSFYVQKQLQGISLKDYWLNGYQAISFYLQFVFIFYLVLVCTSKLYCNVNSNQIFTSCNILLLLIKIVLLVWDIKKFMMERRMLFDIEYQEYTIYWKYIGMLNKILVVVCYGLLLVSDSFYPITLLLEINNVRSFQWIIKCCIQAFKIVIYFSILIQVIAVSCTFVIANQPGVTDSMLDIFSGLNYEIIMFDTVSLVAEDACSYPLLRKIPNAIPVFLILLRFASIFAIASILYEISKNYEVENNSGQNCRICDRSKHDFQSKGVSFKHHQEMEHNVWSYVYFFIYVRRTSQFLINKDIKKCIEKEDYKFLKLNNALNMCWK